MPPTAVATEGTPAAPASSKITGNPSVCDDITATSRFGRNRLKSLRKPANTNFPCKPRCAMSRSRSARSGPSPKSTKPASGRCAAINAAASTKTAKPFSGLNRPAAPADLVGLRLRYAHNRVQPGQYDLIEFLVAANFPGRRGPTVRDGDDPDAGAPRRPPANEVGLVT